MSRRPSGRIVANTVQVQAASFGRDAAGGRAVAYGDAGPSVACSVQLDEARPADEHGRESYAVTGRVYFRDDPRTLPGTTAGVGLKVRDRLVWNDLVGQGRILTVLAIRSADAGRGGSWRAEVRLEPTTNQS